MKIAEDNFETLLNTNVQTIRKDMETVRESKVDKDEFERRLRKAVDDMKLNTSSGPVMLSPTTSRRQTVTEMTKEMKEREEKKNNMIVYNMIENGKSMIKDRNEADKTAITKIIQDVLNVEMDDEEIVKVNRLGSKAEDKKRPLLVVFRSHNQKSRIFSSLKGLRNTDYEHLSFSHDKTKLEREEFKKLIEECKSKEAQDEGKFRYRPRGPPWNQRIVRLPPLKE